MTKYNCQNIPAAAIAKVNEKFGYKWYFVTKIVLTYCEKKLLPIYSNSERSEQLRVTEYFSNLFLEVSHI